MVERIFTAKDRNGTDHEFELVIPNVAAENEGERIYRVAFSKALADGIFPREKLRELMRAHHMWTEDDERELKSVVAKMALSQIDLRNSETEGKDEECKKIASEMSKLRLRMWELFLIQQSVYLNSAEGVAELVKTEAVMAACTHLKATQRRYWKDYSEYVKERDLNPKSTVYSKVIEVQSHLLDEVRKGLMEDYPEAKYLKDVTDRMLDREVQVEVEKTLRTRAKAARKRAKNAKVGSADSKSS